MMLLVASLIIKFCETAQCDILLKSTNLVARSKQTNLYSITLQKGVSCHFPSPTATNNSISLYLLDEDAAADWIKNQTEDMQNWANTNGFTGSLGQTLICPGSHGISMAAIGYGNAISRKRGRFHLAAGAVSLPKGIYSLNHTLDS